MPNESTTAPASINGQQSPWQGLRRKSEKRRAGVPPISRKHMNIISLFKPISISHFFYLAHITQTSSQRVEKLIPPPPFYFLTLFTSVNLSESGMRLYTCNPSTQQMEARGSGVQGHPWLHIDFEASLGYLSICLKKMIHMSVSPWLLLFLEELMSILFSWLCGLTGFMVPWGKKSPVGEQKLVIISLIKQNMCSMNPGEAPDSL